ncbi:MAG: STAS-like domain-containing protein [Thermodesulfovibrionales bacterium]
MLVKERKEFHIDIKRMACTDTVSREHGRKMRKIIEPLLKVEDRIIVDFSNLSIASPSFIDEAFAKLMLKYPLDDIRTKLSFINMTEFDRALLNDLVRARIRERALLEETPRGRFQLAIKRSR